MDNAPTSQKPPYMRAFSKIAVIILISVLCACFVLSIINDLFAFVKPESSTALEITEPMSLWELSSLLQDRGIIENSFAFWAYAKMKGRDTQLEGFQGIAELNSDMGYRDILNNLINF